MGETCLNELGVQRQELMSDSTIPVVLGEQLAGEDQIYREMRDRLDDMGPVNMMALEEYKGDFGAAYVSGDAAEGSAGIHREYAGHDQGDRRLLAAKV